MERAAWTDERFDDLADAIRAGFERTDRDLRDLRSEMNARFTALDTGLRTEFSGVETGLRAEISALRTTLVRIGGGLMVGLVGVIATLIASS